MHSTLEVSRSEDTPEYSDIELLSQISSNAPDLHSGIEGGAVAEPMMDM